MPSAAEKEEATKHTCPLNPPNTLVQSLGSTPVQGRSEGRDIPVLRLSLISDCHPWVQSTTGRLFTLTALPSAVSNQCGEQVPACVFICHPCKGKREPSGCNGKAMTRKRRLSGTCLRKRSMDCCLFLDHEKKRQPRGECI